MKEQFIPYEQALKLKELGFDEECMSLYDENGVFSSWVNSAKNSKEDSYNTATPLWQQAFQWFREKYLLHSVVDFYMIKEKENEDIELFEYKVNEQWSKGKDYYDYSYGFRHIICESHYRSYNEARQACLEKLIEIVQETKNFVNGN